DLRVAAIAAASILAKTERDGLMEEHHERFPEFGWESNKGYAAAVHTAAIRRLGATDLHRRSWKLPVGPEPVQPSLLEEPRGSVSGDGADLAHPGEHVGELLLETRSASRGQLVHVEPAHIFAVGAHPRLGEGRGEGEHDVEVRVAGAEGRGEPVVVEIDRGGVEEPNLR